MSAYGITVLYGTSVPSCFAIVCRRNNLADNLLERMEKYTANLESLMEERTRELVQEKAKTDALLYKMMPE